MYLFLFSLFIYFICWCFIFHRREIIRSLSFSVWLTSLSRVLILQKVSWPNGQVATLVGKLKGPNHSLSLDKCHPTTWDFQGRELKILQNGHFIYWVCLLFVVTFEEPSSVLLRGQMHKHLGTKVSSICLSRQWQNPQKFSNCQSSTQAWDSGPLKLLFTAPLAAKWL